MTKPRHQSPLMRDAHMFRGLVAFVPFLTTPQTHADQVLEEKHVQEMQAHLQLMLLDNVVQRRYCLPQPEREGIWA